MSKSVANFYKSLFEPHDNIWGSKISNVLENNSLVVSLIHLEFRRELKEDYMKV